MSKFVVGLDLGQSQDYTALTVVERVTSEAPVQMHCRHLDRYQLGTLYPDIVTKVGTLLETPALKGATLVVDATGVGRPVVDMFRQAGLKPVAVLITAGSVVTHENDFWRVPKRDLVGAVQVPLQDGRLKFAANMQLGPTLIQEMLNFKVKITESANDTYGAWREGVHDDLILAVMLAAWWAQRPEGKLIITANPFWGDGEPLVDMPPGTNASEHNDTPQHRRWSQKNFCGECFQEFQRQVADGMPGVI